MPSEFHAFLRYFQTFVHQILLAVNRKNVSKSKNECVLYSYNDLYLLTKKKKCFERVESAYIIITYIRSILSPS